MDRHAVDLAVLNAKIYTLDSERPWATALAVRDGKFVNIGSDADISPMIDSETEVVEAGRRLILPALIDSHAHAFEGARADLFEVRLSPADDFDRMIEKVAKTARSHRGKWLIGAGWALNRLVAQLSNELSLRKLDQATGDTPTALRDSSHHAMFVNSAAMKIAGITREAAYGGKGAIMRYPDGTPSGLFLENACTLIEDCVPAMSDDERRSTARHAVKVYNSYGVIGFTHALTSAATMRTFKDLDDAGELKAWVATCIATDSILTPERDGIGNAVIAERANYRSGHIAVDFVKYFMDGVPGAKTAAFAKPYLSTTNGVPDHAKPFFKVAELRDLIAPLDARGIHVKVHAVGDQAIHDTLDAIGEVRRLNGPTGPQHSIAHLNHIFPEDIPRLSQLNVLADFCPPLWFPNAILQGNAAVLGDARGRQAWPIGDVIRSGAQAVIGTDWPIVASPNPWPGLAALITRKDPSGSFAGSFRPDQAISLEQALALCTINVAHSMGFGRQTGSVSEGKSADFIMLDRDLFQIPPEDIANTNVLRTYFSGELVYQSS